MIITRMISTKEEGRGVTFVTDNRYVCRNAERPCIPSDLHPTPSVQSSSKKSQSKSAIVEERFSSHTHHSTTSAWYLSHTFLSRRLEQAREAREGSQWDQIKVDQV